MFFAVLCLTDIIDRRYFHSWLVHTACERLPSMDEATILEYCVLLPLYRLSNPPPPSQTKCILYTDSVWLRGGGEVLICVVDHILQEFYILFLTMQIQSLQNYFTTPSKNDI
jgi:hypothetical protein